MLDDGIQILAVGLPFLQALLRIALELLLLVLDVRLCLLRLCELTSELLLPLLLLLIHLALQLIGVLEIHVLSELLLVGLLLLQRGQLVLPCFLELVVLLVLVLLLFLAALNLILEGFFVLQLQNPLLFGLLPLDLGLFLLQFLDLAVEFFDFVVLDLAHLEGLLGVEFFSLFDLFVDEVLVSLLGDVLNDF